MATPTKELVEEYYNSSQEIRKLESLIASEEQYFSSFGKSDDTILALDVEIESTKRLDKLFNDKERLEDLKLRKADLEEQLIPRLEILRLNSITNSIIVDNNPIFYYLELKNGQITIRKER